MATAAALSAGNNLSKSIRSAALSRKLPMKKTLGLAIVLGIIAAGATFAHPSRWHAGDCAGRKE
jgi:hypothetical protein